ncbi:MAG TPA: cell division protein FtsZ [Nitrospiraceae bacterium]|jgi:cell division protein FtsZ|nr:cell division protein FtsZ [Nitrospiraceae bacterium]
MFEIDDVKGQAAKIKVVGVGGAGGNAINNMITSNLHGVDFISVNTDTQVLETSLATLKVQIGASITKGLGAGADPQIGRQSALEDRAFISEVLGGADLIFITAGMGGGTGTGASPVIASVAKELGALTVAIVTKPFFYEGKTRIMRADEGIKELKGHVDTLIVIPNDRISEVVEKKIAFHKGFAVTDDVLRQAIQGISDIIQVPGLINVDFADVKTTMQNTGRAVMGVGIGRGEGGAIEAAKKAITNPLLEDSSIEGAKGILINITGGSQLSLGDVQEAASIIYDSAHEGANIIFGAVINPDIEDEVKITVIATGFDEKKEKVELPQVKKWAPVKEPLSYRGSERVLAKNLVPHIKVESVAPDMMPFEDPLDVPAFLRKAHDRLM